MFGGENGGCFSTLKSWIQQKETIPKGGVSPVGVELKFHLFLCRYRRGNKKTGGQLSEWTFAGVVGIYVYIYFFFFSLSVFLFVKKKLGLYQLCLDAFARFVKSLSSSSASIERSGNRPRQRWTWEQGDAVESEVCMLPMSTVHSCLQ